MLSEVPKCKYASGLSEFLPYALDYMPEYLQRKAKSELGEDEETRIKSLRLLKTMLKEETDLDIPDNDVILMAYLRARKFDVERAFSLCKIGFNVTRQRSELFYNFDFELVRRTITEIDIGILPYRDKEGCVILVIRTERWNPPEQTAGDGLRALTVALIHASLYPATQVAGFKVIFDLKGLTWRHILHASPTYMCMLGEALHNTFPARFKAIHVVNVNHLLSYLWVIFRTFLTKKMLDRFHFHTKRVTNENLHKLFDPRILPAEFAGQLPRFCEVNKEWIKLMTDRREELSYILSCGYYRSRPVAPSEPKKAKKEKSKTLNIK